MCMGQYAPKGMNTPGADAPSFMHPLDILKIPYKADDTVRTVREGNARSLLSYIGILTKQAIR